MSSSLYLYALLPALILLGWSYTAMVLGRSLPILKDKAIVLLIAHPDDEAMFFAPSVLALTKPELGNHLKILCLSNGNADGLGAIRRHEIVESGKRLGLRSEQDVMVLDDAAFQDGFDAEWAADKISALLSSLFVKGAASSSSRGNSSAPSAGGAGGTKRSKQATSSSASATPKTGADDGRVETTIDALITFDAGGVSGHPNHIALYHGAAAWARSLVRTAGAAGREPPVRVYALTSVNVARKYAGVLDAPLTLAWNAGGGWFGGMTATATATGGKNGTDGGGSSKAWPRRMMFVSDVGQWFVAMGAMVGAHRSQMVWFRWGWITLGRYMVVNDLRRVAV